MVFQCAFCEIKGRELRTWASSEDHCKSICLENKNCMGADYDMTVKHHCYLNWEDVRVVGTKLSVGFKAFRKDMCPGDTLSIHDYYSLKISFTKCSFYLRILESRMC